MQEERLRKEKEKADLLALKVQITALCSAQRFFIDDEAEYSFEREKMKIRIQSFLEPLNLAR